MSDSDNYTSQEESEDEMFDNVDYDEQCYPYEIPTPFRNVVVLCEIYNNKIHGESNEFYVNNGFIVMYRLKTFNTPFIKTTCKLHISNYRNNIESVTPHSTIRNYKNIVLSRNYIKPEIAEIINLDSGHRMCIIKTIWLKLIQRTWKKTYKLKKKIVKQRCHIKSLYEREITGNWPKNCRILPGLKGMIGYLNKK